MFKCNRMTAIPILISCGILFAQPPGGGRGGGIPNATPEQTAAVAQMNADVSALAQSLNAARTAVIGAALADPRNDGGIRASVEAVKAAELALATARAGALARIQASATKLSPGQLAALAANGGGAGGGRGGQGGGGRGAAGASGGRGGGGGRGQAIGATSIPHSSAAQGNTLYKLATDTAPLLQALTDARNAVTAASLADPPNSATVRAKVDAVAAAELTLANARASALASLQASPNRLDGEQLAALVAMGGNFGAGGFSQPEPYDFNDHRGYVSLFDGVSLRGWDGNPKFWRVENGAIVGESTPTNPSGNTYIVNRDVTAHDFTLKFEIKIEGSGGSGLQYRSKTGIPWRRPIAANLGPVNLAWMQTGPQADFWPSQIYSGQFYSENTPMGIMAYRGQVVEGAGMGARRLMGTIGDLTELGKLVKMNDWNEYIVIARGGTFIHVINGQLMAVMVDDDPDSSNNWSGNFGIEIEATTKVSVRNIWLKKLN
jgi:Spy/CpxP family protein refolding chaperone